MTANTLLSKQTSKPPSEKQKRLFSSHFFFYQEFKNKTVWEIRESRDFYFIDTKLNGSQAIASLVLIS